MDNVPARPSLVFVGVCLTCGTPVEPCPAQGPGESWKAAEQWVFLALKQHRPACRGPAHAGGGMTPRS